MSHQNRIMIVDDNTTNIAILEEILSDDYELASASAGEDALELCYQFQPDLILLDIMMPGIDGYEVCRQIRANQKLNHIKVIMLSAKTMTNERLKGYEAGANDYMTKPFDDDELLAKVRVYLKLKTMEEVDQLKDDLLSLIGHETRTPLNAIIPSANMLMDDDVDADERKMLAGMIYNGAIRLHDLLEKTILFSALRSQQQLIARETIDLSSLATSAVEALQAAATERHVKIEANWPTSCDVVGDASLLQRTLTSVLDNAVRFSPSGTTVHFTATCTTEQIAITVTDEGPGIEAEVMDQLLQNIVVADIEHHSRGHGLSLAIAQEVINQHNGTIRVENTENNGACVTVHLPIASKNSLPASPTEPNRTMEAPAAI